MFQESNPYTIKPRDKFLAPKIQPFTGLIRRLGMFKMIVIDFYLFIRHLWLEGEEYNPASLA